VTFLPEGATAPARRGDTLLDAALDHSFDLPHECGGNCTCTTCHIVIEEGEYLLSPMQPPEDERLYDSPRRHPRSRLACQALIRGRGEIVARLVGE
jgi:2Fe-2S ferredoxin